MGPHDSALLVSISERLDRSTERLARMEEHMESWAPAGEGNSCREHKEALAAMEERIKAMEKFHWTLSGKITGVTIMASFLGGMLVKYFLG